MPDRHVPLNAARRHCNILVIEDTANRRHGGDLLLDQNHAPAGASRYQGLLPAGAHPLLGPSYALSQTDYAQHRQTPRPRDGQVLCVLVFFGGTDPHNLGGRARAQALGLIAFSTPFDATAVDLGATVIEKHFTLSRAEGGVDAAFSLEPAELASLVTETERAWQALGQIHYGPTVAEEKARLRRRSLYIAEDLAAGDMLTPRNLRRIRPGHGLAPKYYDILLGKRVTLAVKRGTPVSWSLFA